MESEAGQDIFCVLQGDGYGTKIDFIISFFSVLSVFF